MYREIKTEVKEIIQETSKEPTGVFVNIATKAFEVKHRTDTMANPATCIQQNIRKDD